MNSLSSSFPSIFVKSSEKDESYHKQFVWSITSRSVLSGFASRQALMNECVNFYLGLQGGEEFEFLQKAEDGEVLPAKWMDFNKIAVKVDLLIGELSQRSYKINVKAYNKDAQSRKMDVRNKLLIDMRFQPIAEELEKQHGLPLQSDSGFIPQSEQELDVYMDKTYKETSELVMRGILNYLKKFDNWNYTRIALFRDLLIMGALFARNDIVDGIPSLTRIDPRYMIWDINAKDDLLSDSAYWGEIAYMSIGEVTKRYKITESELQAAYKSYMDFIGGNTNQSQVAAVSTDFAPTSLWGNNKLPLFKTDSGELRIMVVKAFWQDYKVMAHKYSPDKYGNTHVKRVNEDESGDKIKNTTIMQWRQGHLIGGKFLKEWGVMKNQERSVDNIATTTPPYIGLIPNYYNGAIISKVNRLKPLQNLKNIVLYNVQLQIAASGRKGVRYDVSQLPKGWDIHTAMKYMKVAGIQFVDSSKEGAGQSNQTTEYDLGISQTVNNMLEICHFLDAEMDSVSGVNEARQGLIQGASQAVGVTNSALLQSNLSTSMYFTLFSQAFTKIMNKQAGLAKIAWAGKEKFAPIIGDVGVNFLKEDIGLELNDYNVFIEEIPPSVSDPQNFSQLVMAGLQAGQVTLLQALKLLLEPDIEEGVSQLEEDVKRNEEMKNAQEQQMMQQEQQQAQASQQQAAQDSQQKGQLEVMKTQGAMQKILAQGRLDTQQGLLNFKQQLALKNIDLAIQKQKATEKAKTRPKK